MTQVTALLLVGLCLVSPILAYDAYEADQTEEYDAFYGYDDMLSKRDIEIANHFDVEDVFDGDFGDTSEYEIEGMAGPSYDDFYDGGIGLSYYDGYFEDEAPADCTEGDDGQYIVDGAVCDVNVTGADAFLAKAGVENSALDGTYKVAGCKNGLPRYALDAKDDADSRALWFSNINEAWVFGGSFTEEQDESFSPLLFSLDIATRPNFVRPSDWARDFQGSSGSSISITCADSTVLEDPADELYGGSYDASSYEYNEYATGGDWDDSAAAAEFSGGEYYGADFGGGYDEEYGHADDVAEEEPQAAELPSDFQSAYEQRAREGSRERIQELPGTRNRKLSSD